MDVNRMISRPPNRKRVKRQQAKLAAKQSQKRGRILMMSNEKEYGSHEGRARAVKGLGLLLGFGDKCSLSSPKIIAAALLFVLTLLIPSTIGEPWSTGISKAKWKDLIKETSSYKYIYDNPSPVNSLLNIIENGEIVCVGCQSVVECRLLAKIIKDVANLNSDVIRNRKNLKIELEADDSVVFFPATHLGEMPDGSQFNSPRKMSTTDKIKRFFFGSNDLSYLNNEASYLILMTTGDSGFHDSTCDVRVLYENEFLYSVEAFGTIAIFDVTATNETAKQCPTTFNMVSGYNGKIIYYADQTLWLESDDLDSGLTSLEMLEYRECLWPNHTVVGKSETISPFIPLQIGGPPAATNTIPGYGTQNRGPWLYVPLEVRRGNCPGTQVEIWDKCPPPGPSARSTTKLKKTIRNWCCIDCSFPPVHFITQGRGKEECWYAEEIRPIDSSLKPVLITVSVTDSVAAKLAATVKCQMEECFLEQKDEL